MKKKKTPTKKEGGFWKRRWKVILIVGSIYLFLTLPADSLSELIGMLIACFGTISLVYYIYDKFKQGKGKKK